MMPLMIKVQVVNRIDQSEAGRMNDKVSVIIPVYQSESYLDKCISSVLSQSYKAYEVIIIDDGSTDRSGEICDRYAAEHDNVKVYHEKNSGPAASRRKGVEHASGEFIMFVDSDDWIAAGMIEEYIKLLNKYNADVVCGDYISAAKGGIESKPEPYSGKDIICGNPEASMYQLHGTRNILSGPWAKLIRKSAFDKVDFCENVAIGEDYAMVLQLLEHSKCTVIFDKAFYFRCIRKTSISRSGYTERHRQAFDHYERWRMYLLERYPLIHDEIVGYHAEYELAVITAMCRNKNYDQNVIDRLCVDLRENRSIIRKSEKTPFSMRLSAQIIMVSPKLFIILFSIVHVLTGR